MRTPHDKDLFSTTRQKLVDKALASFVSAYDHAISIQRTEERLRSRRSYATIVNEIFEQLGSKVIRVKDTLREAVTC